MWDCVVKHASCYLRNKQNKLFDLFQGCGAVVFISTMSVIAPNAIMVVCGILFGGIHP